MRGWFPGLIAVAIGFFSGNTGWAQLQPEEDAQKGVEVLTRGPIHEAFAEPLTVNPRPNPIIHQQPPAPIEEIPPDQKPEGSNIQWIPGYFAWDETSDDYIWISGFWRAVPPGQQWVAGHWNAVGDGWQWVSGYWAPVGRQEVVYLPPPPPSIDMGPSVAAPDANSIYTPGCWVYQESRYLWRPGFWYQARADWFYTPAHYLWTPAGYIFLDGYWDFPLERRGLLFAPVRFERGVREAGWRYQPSYVLGFQGLLGSLFVRPDFGRYYFGDYYTPEYSRHGFVPWFDHHVGRAAPDPLFAYSRWENRKDPKWEGNLRELHKERVAGNVPRPPTTLMAQNQLIRNIAANKTINIGNKTIKVTDQQSVLKHVTVAGPLSKVEHKDFKLQPVAKARQAEEHQAVQQIHAAAVDRQTRETKIITQNVHPVKPTDPPARVQIAVPKVAAPPRVAPIQPPPHPTLPKHVEQAPPKHEIIQPLRVVPKEKAKEKGKGSAQIQRIIDNELSEIGPWRQCPTGKCMPVGNRDHGWPSSILAFKPAALPFSIPPYKERLT